MYDGRPPAAPQAIPFCAVFTHSLSLAVLPPSFPCLHPRRFSVLSLSLLNPLPLSAYFSSSRFSLTFFHFPTSFLPPPEGNFEDTRAKLQSVRLGKLRTIRQAKWRMWSKRTCFMWMMILFLYVIPSSFFLSSLDIPHFAANLPSRSPFPFSRCLLFLPRFLGRLPRVRAPLFPPFLPHPLSQPSFAHFLSPAGGALIISRHGKSTSPIFRVCRGIVTRVHTRAWTRVAGGDSESRYEDNIERRHVARFI